MHSQSSSFIQFNFLLCWYPLNAVIAGATRTCWLLDQQLVLTKATLEYSKRLEYSNYSLSQKNPWGLFSCRLTLSSALVLVSPMLSCSNQRLFFYSFERIILLIQKKNHKYKKSIKRVIIRVFKMFFLFFHISWMVGCFWIELLCERKARSKMGRKFWDRIVPFLLGSCSCKAFKIF